MAEDDLDAQLALGARRILAAKLALQRELPAGYIHDPAVAMLLALFIERLEGNASTCRSICAVVAYVPVTISGRWLAVMESDGLIEPIDAYVDDASVTLTDRGVATMRETVFAVGRAERQAREDDATRVHSAADEMRRHGI